MIEDRTRTRSALRGLASRTRTRRVSRRRCHTVPRSLRAPSLPASPAGLPLARVAESGRSVSGPVTGERPARRCRRRPDCRSRHASTEPRRIANASSGRTYRGHADGIYRPSDVMRRAAGLSASVRSRLRRCGLVSARRRDRRVDLPVRRRLPREGLVDARVSAASTSRCLE